MKQKPKEIIKDLTERAISGEGLNPVTSVTALLVGFEDKTEVICSSENNKEKHLKDLIKMGGDPIGFVRIDQIEGKIQFSAHPVLDHTGDEWCMKFLNEYLRFCSTTLVLGKTGV